MTEEKTLQPGTRVKFTKEICEEACGDHPKLLYACPGERGIIIHNKGNLEGYVVLVDRVNGPKIRVLVSEFEVIA
jgi:hypothetical protein